MSAKIMMRCLGVYLLWSLVFWAPAALAENGEDSGSNGDAQPTPKEPVGKAPEQKLPEDVADLFDERGALTADGSLIFEPSLEYSHSSANRVAIEAFTVVPAIAIGLIDVREVRRDTVTAAATFRYGLTNRLEVELRLPYVYRDDEVRERALLEPTTVDTVIDSDGDDIGDIEGAIHYQLNSGRGGNPYYIANLRVKSRTGTDPFEVDRTFVRDSNGTIVGERVTEQPTGSGFWGIEPSLTVIYPTDPAVLYGNLSYTWNLERDVGRGLGDVDPGDFLGFNFGMGFGINERTSFSLGYDHTIVFETDREGDRNRTETEFDRINVGSLLLGFAFRLNERVNLNLSLGVGVTEDSPDVQLNMRTPIRF